LELRLPPIPNGEVCTYRVLAGGDSVGTYETVVVHDWVRESPAFALMNVMRTRTGGVSSTDSSLMQVSRARLAPFNAFRFVRTGEALVTTAVNYGEESAAVSAFTSAGDEQQRMLPRDSLTFDTDQLVLLGRALKPAPDRQFAVKAVNPMGPPLGGTLLPAVFQYGGDESVFVPAGSFDCRKVVLLAGENEIFLWYEKAGTGRLVRYEAPDAGLAMELLPPGPETADLDRPVQP
ncbi:hypothetical protein JXB37_06260, partial [candidate division WOR-3 bacterium]|nr:hypothetical protein [candidate division WOR-3 bacterium]